MVRSFCALIKHHARPTSWFTGPDLSRYDRVYRTGEMPDLAEALSARAGRDIKVPHANSSSTRLRLQDLQPQTWLALAEHVAPEYRFLRGHFDNPLT